MTVEVNAPLVRDTALVHLDEVGLCGHLAILVDLEDEVELLGLGDADGPIEPSAVGLHDESALHALEVRVGLGLDLEVDSFLLRLGGRGGLGALHILIHTAKYGLHPVLLVVEGVLHLILGVILRIGDVVLGYGQLPAVGVIGLEGDGQHATELADLDLVL